MNWITNWIIYPERRRKKKCSINYCNANHPCHNTADDDHSLCAPFKATVQAAIGSLALDRANAQTPIVPENVERGQQVLTLCVLSILVTAPIGAILITTLGPRFLVRTTNEEDGDGDARTATGDFGTTARNDHSNTELHIIDSSQCIDL